MNDTMKSFVVGSLIGCLVGSAAFIIGDMVYRSTKTELDPNHIILCPVSVSPYIRTDGKLAQLVFVFGHNLSKQLTIVARLDSKDWIISDMEGWVGENRKMDPQPFRIMSTVVSPAAWQLEDLKRDAKYMLRFYVKYIGKDKHPKVFDLTAFRITFTQPS